MNVIAQPPETHLFIPMVQYNSYIQAGRRVTTSSLLLTTLFALILTACGQQQAPSKQAGSGISFEGIDIQDAWARPGADGGMSAAYFRISNGDSESDTLISAFSTVATQTEVHESFHQKGMMGMREVQSVEVPGRSSVMFEQGGLHIMLIRLQKGLAEGDSVELTLTFARAGDITIQVPVQMMR